MKTISEIESIGLLIRWVMRKQKVIRVKNHIKV